MRIEKKEALYVARYLHKGIIVNNYRDICVSIGTGTEIGATKRGRNCNVYIKYNDRIVKDKRPRLFHPNIGMNELADIVFEEINNCKVISDVELDMNKIPMVSMEEPEIDESDNAGEPDISVDEEYEEYVPEEVPDNFDEPQEADDSEDDECEEIEEEPSIDNEEWDNITIDDLGDEGTEELYKNKVIGPEAEMTDIAPEVTVIEENTESVYNGGHPRESVSYEGHIRRDIVNAGSSHENRTNNRTLPARDNKRLDVERKKKMDKLELSDKDFIVKEFEENEAAVKDNMTAMIDKVIEVNPQLAMQFYEDGILSLLKYYDNDIEQMTEETGMNCKAIYRIVVNLLLHKSGK